MNWSLREWVYVAVFGALWGAVEIGPGSYLHVIFPSLTNTFFTGLILTFIGVAVALIGRRFVPRKGALLMIGVVTAFLKLLSPGGVKLGPMIAILAESTLMEIGLFWRQAKAMESYALAGALAVAWNAVHPFIMLPLLFGRTIGQAYAKLVQDGSVTLGLDARYAVLILLILLILRLAVGAMAGVLAWRLGKSVSGRVGR